MQVSFRIVFLHTRAYCPNGIDKARSVLYNKSCLHGLHHEEKEVRV